MDRVLMDGADRGRHNASANGATPRHAQLLLSPRWLASRDPTSVRAVRAQCLRTIRSQHPLGQTFRTGQLVVRGLG